MKKTLKILKKKRIRKKHEFIERSVRNYKNFIDLVNIIDKEKFKRKSNEIIGLNEEAFHLIMDDNTWRNPKDNIDEQITNMVGFEKTGKSQFLKNVRKRKWSSVVFEFTYDRLKSEKTLSILIDDYFRKCTEVSLDAFLGLSDEKRKNMLDHYVEEFKIIKTIDGKINRIKAIYDNDDFNAVNWVIIVDDIKNITMFRNYKFRFEKILELFKKKRLTMVSNFHLHSAINFSSQSDPALNVNTFKFDIGPNKHEELYCDPELRFAVQNKMNKHSGSDADVGHKCKKMRYSYALANIFSLSLNSINNYEKIEKFSKYLEDNKSDYSKLSLIDTFKEGKESINEFVVNLRKNLHGEVDLSYQKFFKKHNNIIKIHFKRKIKQFFNDIIKENTPVPFLVSADKADKTATCLAAGGEKFTHLAKADKEGDKNIKKTYIFNIDGNKSLQSVISNINLILKDIEKSIKTVVSGFEYFLDDPNDKGNWEIDKTSFLKETFAESFIFIVKDINLIGDDTDTRLYNDIILKNSSTKIITEDNHNHTLDCSHLNQLTDSPNVAKKFEIEKNKEKENLERIEEQIERIILNGIRKNENILNPKDPKLFKFPIRGSLKGSIHDPSILKLKNDNEKVNEKAIEFKKIMISLKKPRSGMSERVEGFIACLTHLIINSDILKSIIINFDGFEMNNYKNTIKSDEDKKKITEELINHFKNQLFLNGVITEVIVFDYVISKLCGYNMIMNTYSKYTNEFYIYGCDGCGSNNKNKFISIVLQCNPNIKNLNKTLSDKLKPDNINCRNCSNKIYKSNDIQDSKNTLFTNLPEYLFVFFHSTGTEFTTCTEQYRLEKVELREGNKYTFFNYIEIIKRYKDMTTFRVTDNAPSNLRKNCIVIFKNNI
tara:strand:- start:11692 stop:14346 length:2655 start_codon:yes stop_codon:yes gene_type:complete